MIEVVRVPVLTDNYVWLLHEDQTGQTAVVDPAVAEPVLEEARKRGWTIGQIWNTHWHPDHTGGNEEIKAATGAIVTAPRGEADRIPTADRLVEEGDTVSLGNIDSVVIDVPAHTAGHIAYHVPTESILFVGDTLFAMGCGRLFEGTAEQMYSNMRKFAELPPQTRVYCAHEYTLSNARYAVVAEPDNIAIAERAAQVEEARTRGEATVPTTIGLELETNPFMRAGSVEELAARRAAKDNF